MTDPSGGIPFVTQNLQEGERYIKRGNILLPCPSFEKPEDILKLPPDEEVITVLGKQYAPSRVHQSSKVLSNASPMGLLSRDKLFDDLQEPGRPLMNDSDLRSRIYERYLHFGGSRYERELPDMLPRSDCCVFTHADIAPRNVKIDEQNTVTGILDWEWAGWYPDYWEYAQIMRPAFEGDFKVWIDGI
ncbi:hypothetical protein CNMCM6936_005828 [Aspergillus lentulus]|nr:hypothetical protein CNMCM6936_005828 [Aspergillus lentulus]